ncbi:OsmC family protein [Variovorax saccharolyticus]|uniref:OsmC family protein n=1 Tax=Variovorax saccharolyticus TaxID=3053516 RepID=UPI0025771923|nr:OsmC family protein [Variovorax sp. J22R187]MDM0018142.1 OsmC family protein [Variovorax sp. J22R187]
MAAEEIAAAWRRAESVLQRRPESGLHDDSTATARWDGGLRIAASHANGAQMLTDMPVELGGTGDRVTPGWLLRAGVASCTATRIAMSAAAQGIALRSLEVSTSSRSDLRGLLGMADADGAPVGAGPRDVEMRVRIAAPGVSDERLRALVEESCRCSPMACALQDAVPLALHIELEP